MPYCLPILVIFIYFYCNSRNPLISTIVLVQPILWDIIHLFFFFIFWRAILQSVHEYLSSHSNFFFTLIYYWFCGRFWVNSIIIIFIILNKLIFPIGNSNLVLPAKRRLPARKFPALCASSAVPALLFFPAPPACKKAPGACRLFPLHASAAAQ